MLTKHSENKDVLSIWNTKIMSGKEEKKGTRRKARGSSLNFSSFTYPSYENSLEFSEVLMLSL